MNTSEARHWQSVAPERRRQTEPIREPKRHVKKSRITIGEKWLGVMYGVITGLALLYIVSFSSNVDAINRDVQRLENQVVEQETLNANLQHQVMEFSNPDRILTIAKENGLKIQNTKVKQTTRVVE